MGRISQFFSQVASAGAAGHLAAMREGHAGEYHYSVERDLAGAGRTVWRWTVCRGDSHVAVASGTSIRSEDDAGAAALRAIERLRAKPVKTS
jgi:hypothetical protein